MYHDLAKGLHSDDHSKLGVEIVKRDFKRYGFAKSFTEEVSWLVNNHLELSIAAFRKNPKARKTWEDLEGKGVQGARLWRLAIFTVIDILATNPEAWSAWKAQLLHDLVEVLSAEVTQKYFSLKNTLQKKNLKGLEEILSGFDPLVLEELPAHLLADDLKRARESSKSLEPLVFKKGAGLWLRFHSKIDQEGVLANYVQRLYSLGLGIRQAAIQTLPGVGVYDWFQVSSAKSPEIVEKMVRNSGVLKAEVPSVSYDRIDWITIDDEEWTLSFRGRDQAGFLTSATQALARAGLNVKSARVHTWGRQVDDIFSVRPSEQEPEVVLKNIKSELNVKM